MSFSIGGKKVEQKKKDLVRRQMCVVPVDMFFRISKLVFEKEKKKINDNETTKNFVIIILCV